MKSTTSIKTDEAQRIAKRLANHWKHKFEVAETENTFTIAIPNNKVTLTTTPDSLDIEVDTPDTDTTMIENVVLDHVNRMAHKEFEAVWNRAN